jgi:hypothetical protein
MWPSEEKIGKAWAETQKPEHYLLLETATFSYPHFTSESLYLITAENPGVTRLAGILVPSCTRVKVGEMILLIYNIYILYIYNYIYIYIYIIVTSLPKKSTAPCGISGEILGSALLVPWFHGFPAEQPRLVKRIALDPKVITNEEGRSWQPDLHWSSFLAASGLKNWWNPGQSRLGKYVDSHKPHDAIL